jgi:formate dehydrogenase major subunit
MVSLTIDGKKVDVKEGTTVLKAAQSAGLEIPTLCDHPSLIPYGGCRLCLVEVEGMRTLQPSCTMPASNNMVVHTDTEKVSEARKFVLSLIFSERNHFCMYCQVSGGDCELQNAAYHEDMTHWPLQPNFQKYSVDASHPDFVLDNNRCILCRRCVRGCGELVGAFTLGIEERGSNSNLIADLGIPLGESSCVSCGTCVQLCPTGALIDRHSAYYGREKDVDHTFTVCTNCSVGCSTTVISREGHILRIEGDWDGKVNQGILCQSGRFTPLYEERERIVTPLVRKDGVLKAATWDEAVKVIAAKFKASGDSAALVSPRLPAETLYTFKQMCEKALNTHNFASTSEGASLASAARMAKVAGSKFEGSLEDAKTADSYLVVGTDLAKEHQVLGFFIKRNLPLGSKLINVYSEKNGLEDSAHVNLHTGKNGYAETLAGIAVQLAGAKKADLGGLTSTDSSDEVKTAAKFLEKASKLVIVYGNQISSEKTDKAYQAILKIAGIVTKSGGSATVLSPKGEANAYASYLYGMEKTAVLGKGKSTFVVLADDVPTQSLAKRLEGSSFIAVQASYASPITAMADVVLPVEMWAEQQGHYLNLDGRIQETHPSIKASDGILSSSEAMKMIADAMGVKLDSKWDKGFQTELSLTKTLA